MLKVSKEKLRYTTKPHDGAKYTKKMDRIYTKYAKAYDIFMVLFPLWKRWLRCVLSFVRGETVIDISFGPAYLLNKLPADKSLFGLDYNETMVRRARTKLQKRKINADIRRGNVDNMPYSDGFFDTVINTMAFSGYPNAKAALAEMLRILKDNGVLLILDYDYPENRNIFGYWIVKLIEKSGNIICDIDALINRAGYAYTRKQIGGFGSIVLYVISKQKRNQNCGFVDKIDQTDEPAKQMQEKIDAINLEIEKISSGCAITEITNHEKSELNDLYQKREEYTRKIEGLSNKQHPSDK